MESKLIRFTDSFKGKKEEWVLLRKYASISPPLYDIYCSYLPGQSLDVQQWKQTSCKLSREKM